VLVVGAGPTGLLLAAELARRDVDCLLIDAHDAPLDWDRATVVHTRSIEIFEALGLAGRILEQGVRVRGSDLRSDGQTLARLDHGLAGSRYGFDLGLSENVTESVLTSYLEQHGGTVTRSTRLVGIAIEEDRAVATIEQHGRRREVSVSWIVGCDGLHSTTRQLAGIDFPGTDLEIPWAVFDASLDGWDADFDIIYAHFDIPPVILTPLPARRWRVYVRPASDTSDLVADATSTLRRYAPGARFDDVENPRRFRCHSRVATKFKSGRVFLAGDAAHACSPSEGHGMNTGLQDAFNLGWKLALACQGAGELALLDSYDTERRPVAVLIAATGDAFESNQAMTEQSDRAERDAAMQRTFADPTAARHEAVAAAELDRSYADSTLVMGDDQERLAPGTLLPSTIAIETAAGEQSALHELTHRVGHTVLVLGGRATPAEDVLALVNDLATTYTTSALIGAVFGLSTRPSGLPLGRIEESVADELGVEAVTILAVRPDRFIGLRQDGTDPRVLARYVEAFAS
jgi:2-polyprenyl-6-methoxyphenol hydroxylase-like FAD-dependent oxidoreductase